jgi:hypothetical protein
VKTKARAAPATRAFFVQRSRPSTRIHDEDKTMTIKPLKKQLLRTKRHLRSVSTSPRALRDADRGLALAAAAAEAARECLCRHARFAA